MIAWAVTLFPEPDSPTIASVLPRSTESETPSTAWTRPSSVGNATGRSFTERNGRSEELAIGMPLSGISLVAVT